MIGHWGELSRLGTSTKLSVPGGPAAGPWIYTRSVRVAVDGMLTLRD